MITVEDATAQLLSLVAPLPAEAVPLREAAGRALAEPVRAPQASPPFAASAMDGYAVDADVITEGQRFDVAGESAAGHPYRDRYRPGTAIRIFTGAPLPNGTTRVLLQEDVTREGDVITVTGAVGDQTHIRPAGGDFAADHLIPAPQVLGSRQIALLAAMGLGEVPVRRKPDIAIVMTGDELRMPGAPLDDGCIYASNGFALAAMLEDAGALARLLPIAADRPESLALTLEMAADADLILTIGGASVGDHDLVAATAGGAGLDLAFHKVAMRPGKPLLAGRLGDAVLVGLPGNPVSSIVCTLIFILPMVRRMLGLPAEVATVPRALAAPLAPNGPRQHYMRGLLEPDGTCRALERQDSSLLSVLAESDLLVLRPPHDPARVRGETVLTVPLPA